MKIQVTKIEAGQTIKVASIWKTEASLAYAVREIAAGWKYAKEDKKKYEERLAKGINGSLNTTGKHNLELKVLEVKEYAEYDGYMENGRIVGFNEKLLVTNQGSYLVQNRNKVTLVD